jgi:hypothetical protein
LASVASVSSQASHLFHGVLPPAQFANVQTPDVVYAIQGPFRKQR